MKHFVTVAVITLFFFSSLLGQAQSRELNDVLEVKLRNTAIILNNQAVVGYAFLYRVERSKKTGTYRLEILDENLKSIGNTEFEGGPYVTMTSSSFEGDHLMFSFNDYLWNSNKKIKLNRYIKVYDLKGNKTGEVNIETEGGNYLSREALALYDDEGIKSFQNVPSVGFISVYQNLLRGEGSKLVMITEEGNLKWEKILTGTNGLLMDSHLLGTTSNTILMFEGLRKSLWNLDEDIYLVGLDAATGEQRFRKPLAIGSYVYDPQDFKFSDDNKLYMTSNISDVNNKFLKARPLGFSIATLNDISGEIDVVKDFLYEKELAPFMAMNGTQSEDGYLQVDDIVLFKDKSKVVFGEFFSLSKGNLGMFNAKLGDAFLLRISPENKVTSLEKIPKAPRMEKQLGYGSVGSTQRYLLSLGSFAYRYTDHDANTDKVSVLAYGQFDGKEKGMNTISFDKTAGYKIKNFAIKENPAEEIAVLRAKPGHVLVSKYNSKEKKISLNLERVD